MTQDELALRFRQWADSEIRYLDLMREAGDPTGRYAAERAGLRRAVAWIESAAHVPHDERLIEGGTRRLRSWEDRLVGPALADARKAAAEVDEAILA